MTEFFHGSHELKWWVLQPVKTSQLVGHVAMITIYVRHRWWNTSCETVTLSRRTNFEVFITCESMTGFLHGSLELKL
jgi:hypothetical protein